MQSRQNPRPCPPSLVRRTPQGPCARPSGTPFGGPASGLWPSGGAAPAAPTQPACSDTIADIFADCFGACQGAISGASPGPICGWTFTEVFGIFGGTIAFSPGQMALQGASGESPGATKPLSAPLSSILGTTTQFAFMEFQTALGSGQNYYFFITSVDGSESVVIQFDDFGNLLFQVGPTALAPVYVGTWTPNNGSHKFHFTIDALGVPTLFIDGVAVPLVFSGAFPSIAVDIPVNTVAVLDFLFGGLAESSPYTNIFIASGILPETTVFCCVP